MQSLLFAPPSPEPTRNRFESIICEAREAIQEVKQLFYSRLETPFGAIWICSTQKGICELHFTDAVPEAQIRRTYPQAVFIASTDPAHLLAAALISGTGTDLPDLHLFGTAFQVQVWQALLTIPSGSTLSYGDLAGRLQLPKTASRAVGTAVGHNPVAVLIPCHRVVGSSGNLTGFRWGLNRKRALLQAELQTL
jgi:AraC family transcriptional regulator of adaptative response/methylated-DNA-[protein]-cysteine methyltransferase